MSEIPQFPPGYRTVDRDSLNLLVDQVNNLTGEGTPGAVTASTVTATSVDADSATIDALTTDGIAVEIPQILAATGSTQGGAAAITKSVVMVTVTASSQGVKLPTAATGKRVTVCAASAKGVKVYPFAGDRIQGAATNVAVALVLNKSSIFHAVNTVDWRVVKGS